MPEKPHNFWQELKRRKVIRVITVYAAAAFVILELVDIVAPSLGLPAWTLNFVIVLLCIGFIISAILSWVYDITPEGIQKTKPSTKDRQESKPPASIGWKISTYASLVIIIAFAVFYIVSNIKQSSDISKLEKTIAVLPFMNFSPDTNNRYLGDAMANEIATELTNIQEFHVRSFTSSLQYKGSNKPSMPQIGLELNTNFIIEGTFELQEGDVSIHVQVILAEDDKHLMAEKYGGDWSDIHTIRANIAKDIASKLKTILTRDEIDKIESAPTENTEAYEYYLKGKEFLTHSYEHYDLSLALKNYQKAIELDPDFVLAHTQLAQTYLYIYWAVDYSLDNLNKAKQAIDTAFKLDPDIPEGFIALGHYYYVGFLNYPEALKQFDLALQHDPNNTNALWYKAVVSRRMGEFVKASEMMKVCFNNDPKNSQYTFELANTYYFLRKYPEALKYYDLTLNLNPEFPTAYYLKSQSFIDLEGNTQKARETYEEAALTLNPFDYDDLVIGKVNLDIYDGNLRNAIDILNTTNFEVYNDQEMYYPMLLVYAKIYDLMGVEQAKDYYDQSRIFLQDKINENPNDPRYYCAIGISYAGLGYKDEALEAGRKALELWPIDKDHIRGAIVIEKLALIYTMVGEYDLALEQLDYLLSNPSDLSVNIIKLDPSWKPLWDLPEFQELIAKYSEN